MYWRLLYTFILISLVIPCSISGQLSNSTYVVITGNKKTKTAYLQRYVQNGTTPSDTLVIENNLRKLRNLPSIMEAQAYTAHTDSGKVITYTVKERYTLFPVGDFGISDDGFWIGGGLMQSNLLGRGLYAYGYYQYNEQFVNDIMASHPFLIILRNPYLKQSNFGFEVKLKSAPSMEQFNKSDYLNEYINLSVAGLYEFRVEHELSVGIGYTAQASWYRGPGIMPDYLSPSYERNGFEPFIRHDIRKLDYHYFYVDGWRNRSYISYYDVGDEYGEPVFTAVNEFRYYRRISTTGNLATRLNTGISTDAISMFQPFIADNYYTIRGIGYRAFRGNIMALVNFEYRQTVYENHFGGIQAVAFTDAGYIANRFLTTNTINENNTTQCYGGLGLRFIYKKAYNAILSADYGFDLQNLPTGTWLLGWGQYF